MDAEYKILYQLLRNLRQEAQLSQTALAHLLHKPQSFVSKYESGERRLDIIELRQICLHLGTDLVNFTRKLEQEIANNDAGKF